MDDQLISMENEFPSFQAHSTGTPVKPRRSTAISGVAPTAVVGSFNNSLQNAKMAILGRVLCAKVDGVWVKREETLPRPGHTRLVSTFFNALENLMLETAPIPSNEYPLLYEGRKRKIYSKAVDELKTRAITREDSVIKMFLKYEKDIRSSKPGRIPRVISPPGPCYLVETGRYVKPVEKKVYGIIDQVFGHDVVVKGRNYSEVGQIFADHWASFTDPVSLDIDVEKMDRSITKEFLFKTHGPILASFPGDDYIRELLSWQGKSKVKGRTDDGYFSYEVEGTLTSGQTNTALVGVLVVCSTMYSYARSINVNIRLVDAGDDCTVVMESKDLERFSRGLRPFFRAQGFELTISEPNFNLEGIEFCQCHPVDVGGQYRMVRNPRDAAIKDAVSLNELKTAKEFISWTNAVSSSGIATHGGIPVAQEFYAMFGRSSQHLLNELVLSSRQAKRLRYKMKRWVVDGSMMWWGRGLKLRYSDISWNTRVSYYLAFGITPNEQLCLEARYRKHTMRFTRAVPFEENTFVEIWPEK